MLIFVATQFAFFLVFLALNTLLTSVLVARQQDHSHSVSFFTISTILEDIPLSHDFLILYLLHMCVCKRHLQITEEVRQEVNNAFSYMCVAQVW